MLKKTRERDEDVAVLAAHTEAWEYGTLREKYFLRTIRSGYEYANLLSSSIRGSGSRQNEYRGDEETVDHEEFTWLARCKIKDHYIRKYNITQVYKLDSRFILYSIVMYT